MSMQGLAMPDQTPSGPDGCRRRLPSRLPRAARDDKREGPAGRDTMATDLEIARAATLLPIGTIAERAGIPDAALIPFGRYKAKLDFGLLRTQLEKPRGKLVL